MPEKARPQHKSNGQSITYTEKELLEILELLTKLHETTHRTENFDQWIEEYIESVCRSYLGGRLLDGANLPDDTPHGQSHAYITGLLKALAQQEKASKRIGHTDAAIAIGTHFRAVPDMQRGIVIRIDKMIRRKSQK